HLQAGDILFADPSVFSIFSYHFLYGDPVNALTKPQTIVLTKTLAKKIFGDISVAVGKSINFGNEPSLVTGIIEDVPLNSHFSFSALRAMPAGLSDNWNNGYLYTYILLKNKGDIKKLEAKMPAFVDKYIKPAMGKVSYQAELQPITSIHLNSNLDYEMGANGRMSYIYIFSLVAALILIIASINYMNLSTARSSLRIKEIGIRKVSGSGRGQLVLMFLAESVLITMIASVFATGILNLAMPLFQHFVGKEIDMWRFGAWQTILLLTGFSLFAGCLSGVYPALFLSGFKLIPSLKGQTGNHTGNMVFRQSLVVFQFVITIAMIAGSFIIYQQLQYVSKKDLGFNKEQVVTFHINGDMRKNLPAVREQLLKNPLIENVATAGNPIGNNNIGGNDYKVELNGSMDIKSRMANQFTIDEDFIPALQIKMANGRNFSTSMPTDKDKSLIVNETLVKDAGWDEPIGKKIQFGRDTAGNPTVYEVVGVVKDFNIYSLQHKIEPLILHLPQQTYEKDNLYVRISKKNVSA
ncbi:MAG: ABC transporter permease, partial [Bacteroidota bacterium]